jgi:hypothetical protein
MTGRERLTAILQRRPTDRLSWSVLADGHTLGACPGLSFHDFCRQLGCEILSLNGWGTPHGFASPALEWSEGVEAKAWTEGDATTWELRSPEGALRSVWRGSHPVKYYVETLEELWLYRSMWEGARYVERDDREAFRAIDDLLGDDGVITRFWGPSTIPRLLETDFGVQSFYYLLHDHPREMEDLIALIHEREMEAFRILARGPWESVTLVENTSTYYISPDVYRRYNGPHVRDFVDAMHAGGKVAILHMCGHVRNLLEQIRDTGADGSHALTPPPTGDTPWELALEVLGEDTIIFGTLDPTLWVLGPIEKIGEALDRLITPRVRRAHFSLLVGADGIRVPVERFETVARWMEANG